MFSITGKDKGILLSSDGLYDELKTREVLKIYKENKTEAGPKLIDRLLDSALAHAALQTSHTKEEMIKLPPGKQKRNMHDDLTLLYVNLQGQASS